MASFNPKKIDVSKINSGVEYADGDGISPSAINDPIEGTLYSQIITDNLSQTPDVSEANQYGAVGVSFVDGDIVNGVQTKKLKFSNLKGKDGTNGVSIINATAGTPTITDETTITPITFEFSDTTTKTVNVSARKGETGETGATGKTGATGPRGATGAKILSTTLIGEASNGGYRYQQTFDDGSIATFVAPRGPAGKDGGVTDYNNLTSKPIINQDILANGFTPVENTYYRHTGNTSETYTKGVIYYYDGAVFKAIDGSGSGGGSANYTKIESTIPTTAWVSSAPSWIGQNALTWSVNNSAYYTQGGTEDLGLVIGSTYTATLTIDGTDYTPEYSNVMEADGMNAYVAQFNSSVMLQILDHCAGFDAEGNFTLGNGYYVMVIPIGETVPSSIIVKSFSGVGSVTAIISNSAIKVNSAVTMYIDYNGKIKAVGKADGSLTLSASATPTVEIPYAIEITDTNVEGLFEIINSYVPEMPKIPTQQQADWEQTDNTAVDYIKNKPEIPTIPTNLPQTAKSVTRQTWAKGETTIEVSDSSITYNSDIDIILSCEEVITGTSDIGKFTLRANSALTKDVTFKYKIKQTSGFGQMNIINNYRIPRDKFSANYLKVRASVQRSDWVASSEYSQYPYQAEIRITALKYLKDRFPVKPVKSIDTITADIVFDVKEALSGIFAPVCSVVKPKSDDEDVKVIIYASEDMTNYAYDYIIIPTIKLTFEGDCGV